MIGNLSARETPLHHLPPGLKLVAVCIFCTALGFTDWFLAGWIGLATVIATACCIGPWFTRLVARDLVAPSFFAVVIILFQLVAGRPTAGLSLAGTLMGCIAIASVFTRTTSPAQVLDVVDRWLKFLTLPTSLRRQLSVLIAITLRFIPALDQRATRLREAHRARSPKHASWQLLCPLAIGALDEADNAAEALRTRADMNRSFAKEK